MNFVTVRDEKGVEKEWSAEVWRLAASSKERGDTRRGHTLVKGKKGPLEKTSPVVKEGVAAAPGFEPEEIAEKVKKVSGGNPTASSTPAAPVVKEAEQAEEGSQDPAPEEAVQPKPNADPANSSAAPASDDLTRIEGIGPKVVTLLKGIGINSFADLINADPVAINKALDEANMAPKKAQVTKWKMEAQNPATK